jgi:hypothetical protein
MNRLVISIIFLSTIVLNSRTSGAGVCCQIFGFYENLTESPFQDTTDYYNPAFLRNEDIVYQKNIRSVVFRQSEVEISAPIINLNSGETLHLEFDDLNTNIEPYQYTVIHCDANWKNSDIWPNEYIGGLQEDNIENYEFAFNTLQHYTHYQLNFPNERMKILLSGNYILKVYKRNSHGDEIAVLTRRFMVADSKFAIAANVIRASTVEDYETRQEVDFTVNSAGYRIDSPYQDIHVTILQNYRWDNALTTLKPFMVRGDLLDYSFDNGTNQFDAGNEFRFLDLKSVQTATGNVRRIEMNDSTYLVSLWDNERRTFKAYINNSDIDGRFLLKTEDQPAVETMGEYAHVHFFLRYDAPVADGQIYIGGAFNGWQYNKENLMHYNFNRHGYEAVLKFKQGYYNFAYMYLPNQSSAGDMGYIEGNHSEAQNTYTILVYQHERGTMYDQLVGMGNFDSRAK